MGIMKSPRGKYVGPVVLAHTPLLVSGCIWPWPQEKADVQTKHGETETWQGPHTSRPVPQCRARPEREQVSKVETRCRLLPPSLSFHSLSSGPRTGSLACSLQREQCSETRVWTILTVEAILPSSLSSFLPFRHPGLDGLQSPCTHCPPTFKLGGSLEWAQ